MSLERFIAYRIMQKDRDNFSRPILRISIIAVALGVAIMLLAVSIVTGFQETVTGKVSGFTSHIRVVSFENNRSWEAAPIGRDQPYMQELKDNPGIAHIQPFALKAGIMQHEEQILGAILKGVDDQFRDDFLKESLLRGTIPQIPKGSATNDIVISRYHANTLLLDTGQQVIMHFIQEPPRFRRFNITGVYSSGMEEMDQRFVFCDMRHIQRLNDWEEDQVAGFEIFLNHMGDLDHYTRKVYANTEYNLKVENIRSIHPQIMDWLDMLNTNVIIIIALMLLVSAITMVSTLLILILEKTNMIGILKAMGCTNRTIEKIFIVNALYITGRGLIWGNITGLGLMILQKVTGLITLDESTYYMSHVPINIDILHIGLINGGTILVCFIFLLLPAHLVTRIHPVKAIRFS